MTSSKLSFDLPSDLIDCFAAAGGCIPEMYLDASVRSSMSAFAVAAADAVEDGIRNLAKDLESDVWDEKHSHLHSLETMDVGYRFVVSA